MKKPIPLSYADQLRFDRESLNLSQVEVATALGISQALYSHYENGNRVPPKDRAKAIPKALQSAKKAKDAEWTKAMESRHLSRTVAKNSLPSKPTR